MQKKDNIIYWGQNLRDPYNSSHHMKTEFINIFVLLLTQNISTGKFLTTLLDCSLSSNICFLAWF